jgi:hypothetical protein
MLFPSSRRGFDSCHPLHYKSPDQRLFSIDLDLLASIAITFRAIFGYRSWECPVGFQKSVYTT